MAEIILTNDGPITTVTINRPKKHNAFDDVLIHELTILFNDLNEDDAVHAVILAAAGENFSAGADLAWMKKMANFSKEENLQDALKLATLLKTINTMQKPTIAAVQGKVFGGGIGLIACCDFAIATESAEFCFSEIKLGLIPATIAPYILAKIGQSNTRNYFLSAETFNSHKAKELNLIHQICKTNELHQTACDKAKLLAKYPPHAIAAIKQLLQDLNPITDQQTQNTAQLLAEIRQHPATQALLQRFLAEK